MVTRAMHVQLVLAVVVVTLCRTEACDDVCGLDTSRQLCSTADDWLTSDNLQQQGSEDRGHAMTAASCEFTEDMCQYANGCGQEETTQWTHNSTHTGFVEAAYSAKGNDSSEKSPTLESPLIHISEPSCLTINASTSPSSQLAVLVANNQDHCSLGTLHTQSVDDVGIFQLNLPVTVAKVLFQAVGGGENGTGVVRLFSVSIRSGCCTDKDWFPVSLNPKKWQSPHCDWDLHHLEPQSPNASTNLMMSGQNMGSLTSPVIGATAPRHFDCLIFKYFVIEGEEASLTVSILPGPNGQDSVPKWRVFKNIMGQVKGTFDMASGQLPLASPMLFKIRITVKRKSTTSVIMIQDPSYSRGNTTPCSFFPPDARVPHLQTEPQGSKVGVPVIAGITVAAVAILAVTVICTILCCRKRHRSRRCEKSDIKETVIPITDILKTGRPTSSNSYSNCVTTGETTSFKNPCHVTDEVSEPCDALASPSDVTSNAANVDKPEAASDPAVLVMPDPHSSNSNGHQGDGKSTDQVVPEVHVQCLATHPPNSHYHEIELQNGVSSGETGIDQATTTTTKTTHPSPSSVYHEQEPLRDSSSNPQKQNPADGSTVYDRLGVIKGGNDRHAKAREGTAHAYDHVGVHKGTVYDLIQRNGKQTVVDCTYHHLDSVHTRTSRV